jgi:hypothetical protein
MFPKNIDFLDVELTLEDISELKNQIVVGDNPALNRLWLNYCYYIDKFIDQDPNLKLIRDAGLEAVKTEKAKRIKEYRNRFIAKDY